MKEISARVRKGYLDKLEGISLNGISIPVYDTFAASDAPSYYILLKDINAEEDASIKNVIMQDVNITVDVVTKFTTTGAGSLTSELIGGIVTQLIAPNSTTDYINLAPDFQVLTTRKLKDSPLNTDTGTEKEYRRILIFNHKVKEN